MLELAVLGVLREGPLHGYELKKRLCDVLGPFTRVSFGSLYPALERLERSGAVQVVADEAPAPPMPMTGSFTGEAAAFRASRRHNPRSGRTRKVYAVTPCGHERLGELLDDEAEDDRSFPVKLAFARWCDPSSRVRLLQRRRAALVVRLDEGRRSLRSRGERADRYLRSLIEHDAESTERDIAWLDHLISTEQTAGPGGPTPPPSGGTTP